MKNTICLLLYLVSINIGFAQDAEVQKKLKNFDKQMEQVMKDWNMPGVGVGVVKNGKLVFMKGYGYRDYEKKLPITGNTLFQIASNTKLFTATAVGFLVDQGKLDWDKPIKTFVPSIQFYNNELNNTITVRDMLAHRTGVTRHDLIWYKSDFNRSQLFDKLKYLEPAQPLRQGFLYNNLMYAASGHIIDLIEGKKWETYVQEKILNPLKMNNTFFSIADMKKQQDIFVPFNEKRDTNILYKIPYLEQTDGLGPVGSMISNINDLSNWLIALMNKGKFDEKQIIPEAVVNATKAPSIALNNSLLEQGFTEVLNPFYGMGRQTASYRGHQLLLHGGDFDGIHSQISYMPQDNIGVIVFVIGDHGFSYNSITYNIYEHLLGLSITPWSERGLKNRDARKKIEKDGRKNAQQGQIKDTKPSHPISDYLGEFEDKAYGIISITQKENQMFFKLNAIQLPLNHFHYDRFDTTNDEEAGFFSINYQTNPQGEIDQFLISLDEGEVTFTRKSDSSLSTPEILTKYTGKYKIGTTIINLVLKNKNQLFIQGSPDLELIPYKPNVFKIKEFADFTIEFVLEDGKVTAMKQKDGSGEYEIKKE